MAAEPLSGSRIFTVAETAEILRVSDEHVRKLIRGKLLEGFPVSLGKKRIRFRVTQESIDKFQKGTAVELEAIIPAKPQLAFPKNVQLGRGRVIKKSQNN